MTLRRRMGEGQFSCWPTPVVVRRWPRSEAFDQALVAAILARRQVHPGITTSVAGGWQSEPDLLCWPLPEVTVLRQRISDVTRMLHDVVTAALREAPAWNLVAEAWAVVHDEGHSHDLHSHPGSVWSGVYYAAVPEGPDAGGTLELLDPRPVARALVPQTDEWFQLEPQPATMVAFPSWILHRVAPVRKRGPRVCVAFNVGVPRGQVLR